MKIQKEQGFFLYGDKFVNIVRRRMTVYCTNYTNTYMLGEDKMHTILKNTASGIYNNHCTLKD